MRGSVQVAFLFLLVAVSGCKKLAEHGVGTVSFGHDVGCQATFDGWLINEVAISNMGSRKHTNVKAEFKFFLENGDVITKTFSAGHLEPNEQWKKHLDATIADVDTIQAFYSCDQGANKAMCDSWLKKKEAPVLRE